MTDRIESAAMAMHADENANLARVGLVGMEWRCLTGDRRDHFRRAAAAQISAQDAHRGGAPAGQRIAPVALRQTHTFAKLAVSAGTYREVERLLRDAGYDHALMADDEGGVIDMHGIALCIELSSADWPENVPDDDEATCTDDMNDLVLVGLATNEAAGPHGGDEDDGCPKGDPECLGGDCHDTCMTRADRHGLYSQGN